MLRVDRLCLRAFGLHAGPRLPAAADAAADDLRRCTNRRCHGLDDNDRRRLVEVVRRSDSQRPGRDGAFRKPRRGRSGGKDRGVRCGSARSQRGLVSGNRSRRSRRAFALERSGRVTHPEAREQRSARRAVDVLRDRFLGETAAPAGKRTGASPGDVLCEGRRFAVAGGPHDADLLLPALARRADHCDERNAYDARGIPARHPTSRRRRPRIGSRSRAGAGRALRRGGPTERPRAPASVGGTSARNADRQT